MPNFSVYQWIQFGFTVAVLAVAVYTDVRRGKIYNALTAPVAIAGILLNALMSGWQGALLSIAGIVLGVGLWFVVNIMGRILGAGDSKLLACIGALNGPVFLLYAIAATALAGGVLAIIVALWRGYLKKSLYVLVSSLYARIFHKTEIDIKTAAPEARLPYAVPILVGTLVAFYYVTFIIPSP